MDSLLKVDTTGVAGVKVSLENIRVSVQRRILASAMNFGVKPLKPAEAAAVPVRFGTLRRSIGVRIKRYKASVFAAVGPLTKFKETVAGTFPFDGPKLAKPRVNKPAKYAHLVEKGVAPHFIPAPGWGRKAKGWNTATARKMSGKTPGWQHPGHKGTPFINSTARAQRGNVFARFAQHLKKRVEAEWKKASAKDKKFFKGDTQGFGR